MVSGSSSEGLLGEPLSHGLASDLDAVGGMDEPVEDGVGERGVADCRVPFGDRDLAGDEGRGPPAAILVNGPRNLPTFGLLKFPG